MAKVYTLKLAFTTTDGTKTISVTPAKANISAGTITTAMDTLIANTAAFKYTLTGKKGASIVATETTTIDINESN